MISTRTSTSSVSSLANSSATKSSRKGFNFFSNSNNNQVNNNNKKREDYENLIFLSKKDHLREKLDQYSIELPSLCEDIKNCMCSYDESILEIEHDWNNIVGDSYVKSITVKQARQQMAIWELFTTEVSHLKLSKVIIDVIFIRIFSFFFYQIPFPVPALSQLLVRLEEFRENT